MTEPSGSVAGRAAGKRALKTKSKDKCRLTTWDHQSLTLAEGAHRICTAEATLERVMPLMSSFGITRLANVTGLDKVGLPVVIAIRPNARSIAVSQGKGRTLAHAKASALMESIEIWHAEHFDQPVHFASIADLEVSHGFIDHDRLPETPMGAPKKTQRLHWVEARDLISGTAKLVPLEMVHADYTHPVSGDAGFYPASTNGLASGNHPVEATCHAICEVVERDALSIWHHLPLAEQEQTRLDLDSVSEADLQGSIQLFQQAGLDCAIWDVTSDTGVATFLCIVWDKSVPHDHCGLGSGTHPDPVVALHRALNEAAQTRLNYISGAREDLFHDEYTAQGRADKFAPFDELLENDETPRRFDAVPSLVARSLTEELDWLKSQLQSAAIEEIAVVDLTREDLQIPVVRVIIPGLEAPHDDSNYVPGRRALRAMRSDVLK